MRPLKILNNVEKGRLLHSLFTGEIPKFIAHLREHTDAILEDQEQIKANWKEQLFCADLWLSFAEDVQVKLAKYPRELEQSSAVFADQLFDGYTALYLVQQLMNYGETVEADPKFIQAVELIFV
jgi:hypothetical protein